VVTALLIAAALCGDAAPATEADSLTGKVRIAGSSFRQVVSLLVKGGEAVKLSGDLDEIMRLQSIEIEVLGKKTDQGFDVASYRILDIGGGARPVVGRLVQIGDDLALRDGDGSDIPLSLPPRAKARLLKKVGAKVWIHGKKLLTGQLKVLRYGVLRDPAGAAPPPPPTNE